MKRILLSTAFALATTGAAVAQDPDTAQLRDIVSQELSAYGATDVTVDQMTDTQVTQFYLIATSGDPESVKHLRYDSVLAEIEGTERPRSRVRTYRVLEGDADVEGVPVTLPRNQLRTLVDQMLETYEMGDVDVMTLTDEQLTELYLIDTGGESESEKMDKIRGVLGG